MKVKLEDIAIKSGYSIATVSRVLSGKAKGQSQSVYDIIHTARELGYRSFFNQYHKHSATDLWPSPRAPLKQWLWNNLTLLLFLLT